MKEAYLGSDIDRGYIKTYLENIRKLDPVEVTTLPNAICLNDERITEIINPNQFQDIAYRCLERIRRRYGIDLDPVSEDRYYTVSPPEDSEVGGFHDPRSLGYQYWYHASFVVALNSKMVSSTIRTLEMARNFLHDCLHHSTFRSYRRAVRVPANSRSVAKHRVMQTIANNTASIFGTKMGYRIRR